MRTYREREVRGPGSRLPVGSLLCQARCQALAPVLPQSIRQQRLGGASRLHEGVAPSCTFTPRGPHSDVNI